MGDSSLVVKIAAIVNIISSLLIIGCQIALYFVPYYLGFPVWITDEAVIFASIGIWGGLIIFIASTLFVINKGGKMVKFSIAALAAVIGVVILGVFSNEINYLGTGGCRFGQYNWCGALAVDALLVTGGIISTLASGFLALSALKSN